MARCTKCNHKWSVKDIVAVVFSNQGKDCPNCMEKQYISSTTKNIMNLVYAIILFVIIFPSSTIQKLIILGCLILLLVIIFPFIIKISDK